MTWTQTTLAILDGAGTSRPVIAYTDGTNYSFAHPLLDNTGAIIAPANAGNQTAGNASLATIATASALASTSALQSAANTLLTVIEGYLAGTLAVGGTVAVSGSALPTGAATATAQATGNASLATIATAVQAATPAGTNLIGSVSAAANTSGGTSTYAALGGIGNALLTNSPVAVKASAGNLYGVNFVNTGAADAYVQVFDVAAGSVTLGTTPPKLAFWVPKGGAWEEKFTGEAKISFANAITIAATTTSTGNTVPATGVLANVVYK